MEGKRIKKGTEDTLKAKKMNKATILLIFILIILAGLTGYNYFFHPFENINQEPVSMEPSPVPSPTPEPTQAEKLLEQLTPEQKVAQVLALPVEVDDIAESTGSADQSLAFIQQFDPGFVTFFGTNVSTVSAHMAVQTVHQQTADFPLSPLIAVDHEGGNVQRLRGTGFTRLPSWSAVCDLDSTDQMEQLTQSAQELHRVGIDLVFAPVLDYGTNSILGSRICSDNPQVVIQAAQLYIQIFQQQSILPVIKHFPGIGKTARDLHTQFDQVLITDQDADIYRTILDTYPSIGVMVTHVGVENQYQDIPCSLSKVCVGQLTQQYPQALIFSDALEMKSATHDVNSDQPKEIYQVAKEAILAGDEVLVFGEKVSLEQLEGIIHYLTNSYQTNQEFAQQLDQAVLKIINYKLQP